MTPNALADPLVCTLRDLRHARHDAHAYRELLLLTLGLLSDTEKRFRTAQRTIRGLREELQETRLGAGHRADQDEKESEVAA